MNDFSFFTFALAVILLMIGWHSMKALEKIAAALELISREKIAGPSKQE